MPRSPAPMGLIIGPNVPCGAKLTLADYNNSPQGSPYSTMRSTHAEQCICVTRRRRIQRSRMFKTLLHLLPPAPSIRLALFCSG